MPLVVSPAIASPPCPVYPRWAAWGTATPGPGAASSGWRGLSMKQLGRSFGVTVAAGVMLGAVAAQACTSIVVSRGASKDGSVMITYSADAPFMPRLLRIPGGVHSAGDDGRGPGLGGRRGPGQGEAGRAHLHRGRPDERAPALARRDDHRGPARAGPIAKGQLDYDGLMSLTLQRAKTAREAIADDRRALQGVRLRRLRARPSRSPTRTRPGSWS